MEPRPLPERTTFEALFAPNLEHDYLKGAELHPFPRTGPRIGEFELAGAWWLAELALLTYVEDEGFVQAALERTGLGQVQRIDVGSSHVLLADDLVVFRGTDDLHDLVSDLDVALVAEGQGRVHRGFLEALDLVWTEVSDAIGGRDVVFAGHSLGAALATIAASRHGQTRAVYTFGSPRVGDEDFGSGLTFPVYRFVNNNDVVTRLPPPLHYRHVGELYYFDEGGRLLRAPSRGKRLREQLRGHGSRLKDNLKRWLGGELDAIPYDSLIDHSPLHYAVHLGNNLAAGG